MLPVLPNLEVPPSAVHRFSVVNGVSVLAFVRALRFGGRLLALWMLLGLALPAAAFPVAQEFFVPMPEAQIRDNFLIVAPNTGTEFESVISVVVPSSGTRIVYDQWEDGYELDIENPSQSSSRVWGDGNNANGIAPGFVNDPAGLSAGTVLTLRNIVPLPRSSTILFDARDRLGASSAVVMTRAAWATVPGPLLADAVSVPATADYGTSFVMPLGQDVIFPAPLTASMFEDCAMFIMASQNGTVVQIDADANGAAEISVTINRGQSYLVNGTVNKGATVTASRPVQVQLITGDIGANYESRWYNIPPTSAWSSEYLSPVGTAADGDQTYIWLYNAANSPITVNFLTKVGPGSFSIPAKDVYRFLMPQNSGARFTSVGSAPFFAMGTVGANPSANNVHDWGFNLVPSADLTSELVVGWGPGSRDLTANGNPAWITALAPTTLYLDYDGDRAGPLTDPNGGKYDLAVVVTALDITRVYETADRNQTALRIYTLDGTLITGAWGQDPAVAGPAEPFLDMGTTIPNLPVPILTKTVALVTDNGTPGLSVQSSPNEDVVEYTITLQNRSLFALFAIQLSDVLPTGLTYVPGSTTRDLVAVADAANPTTAFPLDEGGIMVPTLLRGATSVVKFRARIVTAGQKINVANTTNPTLSAQVTINVPVTVSSACTLFLTTNTGTETDYQTGAGIYVTLTDADANTNSGTVQTVSVVVQNLSNGDVQSLVLTETTVSSGIFRNTAPLPSSTTAGGLVEDGTIRGVIGDTLSVSYTDPVFGGSPCSDTATFIAATLVKQLYLDTDGADGDTTGDLDRVDPVATADGTVSQTSSLAVPASSTIARAVSNSSSTGTSTTATSLTFSHTPGSGLNRVLVVTVAVGATSTSGSVPTVTGVQFNSTAMTLVGSVNATGNAVRSYMYRLIAPSATAANVVISLSGVGTVVANASTFTGVHQTTPFGTYASASGASATPSVTVVSAAGEWVIGSVAQDSSTSIGLGAGQTALTGLPIAISNPSDTLAGHASTEAGAASVTHSYTSDDASQEWAVGAAPLRPASPAAGGSAVFTQTPTFCLPFTMPSGGSLTVRNYVKLPTGTLSASPAITATLRRGVTTIATLSSPSAVAAGISVVGAAAVDTGTAQTGSSRTFSYSSGTHGIDRILMVGISYLNSPTRTATATYNGVPMTLVGTQVNGTAGRVYIYQLVNPTVGANNLTVTWSGALTQGAVIGAVTYAGVDQTTPTGTFASATGTSAAPAVSVGSATGALVFGVVQGASASPYTSGNTSLWSQRPFAGTAGSGGSAAGAASVNLTWAGSNNAWVAAGVSLTPSALYQVDWSTTLGSSVTVPANEAINLTVENNTATAFNVLYDSSTYPSVISLPATTVVKINSLDVYDAPYPGGSIITAPGAGQIVYVRGVVSDPFGAYDITGMTLGIDGPGTLNDLLPLTVPNPSVVASDTCTKTFEYVWNTGATLGDYVLVATASEGYENAVTDTRSTIVNITQLDLGTPCQTEFTATSNGTATTTYAANGTIFVRVTDLDQNLNAAAAETVSVTLTSSTGDSETWSLTETGINTGVFVGSRPSTTSGTAPGGVNNNNGTLHAIVGSTLTLNYTDPTDSLDPCSASASIAGGAAAISVTKTLLTPADGQIVVGQTAQFRLRVVNTGSTILNTAQVVDTFDDTKLSYLTGSPAPNSTTATTLTWNNVGPLNPGQSVDLFVTFTGLASANPTVNTVNVTTGGGPTASATRNIIVTRPAITVTKTRLTPASGSVALGASQSFRIVVQNTGDTVLTTVPLEDTFSDVCLQYVSASSVDVSPAAPNSVSSGSLLWNDITGAGTLAVGATRTIDVIFNVVGGCNPADNVAAVNYAVDANGDPVPPDDGAASVTTLAASISGRVYEDQGAVGFGGDVALEFVTVRLFTDPNGDGNPSDGTLVAVTDTDSTGYYEFLNLGLGNYVVVEEDITGYFSVDDTQGADTDNRIAVPVTTLTAYPNNNFLDDVVDTSNYVLVGNRIWNDNGAGAGGVANDGLRNGTEPGINGVTVEVYAADGLGYPTGPMLASDVTAGGGYYAFFLPPGDYVILVPPSNFGSGQPLVGLFSSGTSNGTFNGRDPDTFPADDDDNGYNSVVPQSTGVMTAAFTLTSGGEPTGETDLGPGDAVVADNRSNLTVDLGFASIVPTAIRLAYVKGWWEAGEVTLEWETINELNTLGFEIYRLDAQGPVLVNADLVPALNVELGGVYRVRESMPRPRGVVRYLLVELETTGRRLEYGPFEIAVAPPARMMSVRMVGGTLEFEFHGEPSAEYLVETTNDLTSGRWTESGTSRSDSAGLIRFHQKVDGSDPVRFFRALRR